MGTLTTFTLLLIFIAVFILALRLSLLLAKRAVCRVVSVFRAHKAIDNTSAVTLKEIGLTDRPIVFSFGLRDYRPYAVQMLIKEEVLQRTPDNRVYLLENRVSEFEERTHISCLN